MRSKKTKAFVFLVLGLGATAFWATLQHGSGHWIRFTLYLLGVLLSSGMKVQMLKSDSTMSVNFPFILLGMVDLAPAEVAGLAICSVIAQCNFEVAKPFTLVQIAFNVANVTISTALATLAFAVLGRTAIGLAPAIAIAAGLYFLVNTIPVATVIAFETSGSPWRIWRSEFFWYFPFYLVGALIAAVVALLSRKFGWPTAMLLVPLVYAIYRTYNEQIANLKAKEQHIQETRELHLRTIEALAMAIEAKDQGTHKHLQRVRVYVSELGRIMKLDADLMQALVTAAVLHDIGKLAIPERIINKPGKLTKDEFDQMKMHPEIGADLLERVRFPYPVVPIVRSHHECWDGSGYPDGLEGKDIPLGARILSVVDCFDALAADRPYRKALSTADALAVLKSKARTQFDPQIVELLETHLPYLEEQAALQIDTVAPLNTNILVERGASPGAGFQMEHEGTVRTQDPGPGGRILESERAVDHVALAGLEADALLNFSRRSGISLRPPELCALMALRILDLVPFDCFAVFIKDKRSLMPVYMHGKGSSSFSNDAIEVGQGITGWVAETELAIVNGNPTVEPTHLAMLNPFFAQQSSALSIPLFEEAGPLLGVLSIYLRGEGAFSSHHLQILQTVQAKFSLMLEAARNRTAAMDSDILSEDARGADPSFRLKGAHGSRRRPQVNAPSILEELVPACPIS